MMQGDTWRLESEDKARLEPLLQWMIRRADYAIPRIVTMVDTVDGALEMLQGYCEYLAEQTIEKIMQQIDRGEWAARGITKREQADVVIDVDARAAYYNPDAKFILLSFQPSERLS